MTTPAAQFLALDASQKKQVHNALCRRALAVWEAYCQSLDDLSYIEAVVGTEQQIDPKLPRDAFDAVVANRPDGSIAERYYEPITALQDDDLEFPDAIEFAYYAVYNLFQKYAVSRAIDDWLIVNQALSAYGEDALLEEILSDIIREVVQSGKDTDHNPDWS